MSTTNTTYSTKIKDIFFNQIKSKSSFSHNQPQSEGVNSNLAMGQRSTVIDRAAKTTNIVSPITQVLTYPRDQAHSFMFYDVEDIGK